jgi:hypothetical protein
VGNKARQIGDILLLFSHMFCSFVSWFLSHIKPSVLTTLQKVCHSEKLAFFLSLCVKDHQLIIFSIPIARLIPRKDWRAGMRFCEPQAVV